ncbi:aminotransferase class III-fold pyridoxal phosphate-dependent enzyme [Microbacterium sp.]|uniref:aspartate aminotransferase family protein n=1 Tax=Microbacterium sp. TaxID=51671 RepID=UPI00262B4F9A|nr:aminotransferase class III-fold pyridoxal phosphate-dependent enzyme [Microbacterium sp.]
MTARRERVLGPSYRLFYRDPIHLVRGSGTHVWDADGRRYLDVYNNVVSVGHAHPRVVQAIAAQAGTLNTHTRYLHGAILDYADDILTTLPHELSQIMFLCTGSEANDLAVRVAQHATGARGIIVTREAYHGNTALTSQLSPALGSGQLIGEWVRLVDPPDTYRADPATAGVVFAADVRAAIDSLREAGHGFAGLLIDSMFSSDGVLPGEPGMLTDAVDVVHAAGGVLIADEVQPGFGRTGETFWGFARHGIIPDLVTMGKPMGNGHPVAGLAARAEILAPFATAVPYFNTFGGNPVSIAAAQATLSVLRDEGLQFQALRVGAELRTSLIELADRHPLVGDVRGAGLFTGLELVTDRTTKEPASAVALAVVDELRDAGVLTSVTGAAGNILKLRPPLAFGESDAADLAESIDLVLGRVEL